MTLVSKKIINFISPAVLGNGKIINNFNLKKFIKNKISIIFFWPMDFTFICPTELITLNKYYNEIKNKQSEIIGISTDSKYCHKVWRKLPVEKGGVGKIKFPMVSDIKKNIIKKYKIEYLNNGIALRAMFIADKKNIIRFEIINDLNFGRNIEDIIRMIDSIIYIEKNKKICPAKWKNGIEGIDKSSKSTIDYINKNII